MHVYVLYAHPSIQSFTHAVLEAFTRGLKDGGHSFEIGDLYAMNFTTDMTLAEYERETCGDANAPLSREVAAEHEKIASADGLAFVYPVWWSDCPAKLKGWFDRVLAFGYAYTYEGGAHTTSKINIGKALVICPAGHTEEHLEETGIAESMRKVMIHDRLLGVGVRAARMEVLGGMVLGEDVMANRKRNLQRAYECGRNF